jgi:hypothetical protein
MNRGVSSGSSVYFKESKLFLLAELAKKPASMVL